MKCFSMLTKIFLWLFKDPQGLGTLLIGIAALIALYQTSEITDKILQIQNQAAEIKVAVAELKNQSTQVAEAVHLLVFQLKEQKAQSTVKTSPALNQSNPSRKQIEEVISSLPSEATPGQSSIYLPKSRFREAVDQIDRAKTPEQRATVLQNFLEYQPSKAPPSSLSNSNEKR